MTFERTSKGKNIHVSGTICVGDDGKPFVPTALGAGWKES